MTIASDEFSRGLASPPEPKFREVFRGTLVELTGSTTGSSFLSGSFSEILGTGSGLLPWDNFLISRGLETTTLGVSSRFKTDVPATYVVLRSSGGGAGDTLCDFWSCCTSAAVDTGSAATAGAASEVGSAGGASASSACSSVAIWSKDFSAEPPWTNSLLKPVESKEILIGGRAGAMKVVWEVRSTGDDSDISSSY